MSKCMARKFNSKLFMVDSMLHVMYYTFMSLCVVLIVLIAYYVYRSATRGVDNVTRTMAPYDLNILEIGNGFTTVL